MHERDLHQARQEHGNVYRGRDLLLEIGHEATGTGDRLDATVLQLHSRLDEDVAKGGIALVEQPVDRGAPDLLEADGKIIGGGIADIAGHARICCVEDQDADRLPVPRLRPPRDCVDSHRLVSDIRLFAKRLVRRGSGSL
ncbi:hypothetical protein D9M72_591900 [compost metagenome]